MKLRAAALHGLEEGAEEGGAAGAGDEGVAVVIILPDIESHFVTGLGRKSKAGLRRSHWRCDREGAKVKVDPGLETGRDRSFWEKIEKFPKELFRLIREYSTL